MDKRSVLGFVLIGVILVGWLYWSSISQREAIEKQRQEQERIALEQRDDSVIQETDTVTKTGETVITQTTDTVSSQNIDRLLQEFGEIFYTKSFEYIKTEEEDPEKFILIENDLVEIEFTNHGGTVRKYTMKKFKTWNQEPVQLVDWSSGRELHLLFTTKDGKTLSTRDLYFDSEYENWSRVDIQQDSSFTLSFSLNIDTAGTQKIVKTYSFNKDSYEFEVNYTLLNSDLWMTGGRYQIVWGSSLNLTEFRSDEEAGFSEAFAYMGGELQTLEATDVSEVYVGDYNGNTDYVSSRNKYFGVFIITDERKGDGAYLSGQRFPLKDEGVREEYSIAMKMDVKNDKTEAVNFNILIVPLDYQILKAYGRDLELTMRFPLDFLVRPIAQWFIIPFFNFLHTFIPNFGFVIIVFAICLKILLNPLMKKQMESMKKLSKLSPKMTEIREKYKDDPVKANQQIMKMYQEEGINPAGGCLPLLLQLPILYALFGVFRSTIELRQQPFIWWIKDLSAPDVIAQLPFKIPIFGIDQISGVALLMGITMFIQQKMMMTDPKQKALVYIMPVMLTLLFFNFPSGLNLYYFMFNLLTIGQQWYTNKFKPEDKTPVKPKKESWMMKLQKRAEEIQKDRSKMSGKRRR